VQATCTDGPSLPTESPEAITRGCVRFRKSSHSKRGGEHSHQRQTLDEERPEAQEAPHDEAGQYTLNLRNARTGGVFCQGADEVGGDEGESSLFGQSAQFAVGGSCCERTHSEKHVYEPSRHRDRAPQMPRIACAVVVDLQLPAAELLVQPPAVRAISHLHVREPFRDYGYERGVDSDTSTCEQQDVYSFALLTIAKMGPTDDADD
jgi:hypothetical protein